MSIVAGCDVGSLTSKAVIMKDRRILGSSIVKSKTKPEESAEVAMAEALTAAGVETADIECCIGTGYGRERIPFVRESISEIACHGRGAKWLVPAARTVIDIGGQDCKAIKLNATGKVENFITNDKCASGTGRFLEVMADALDVELTDMGDLSEQATRKLRISNQCVIFAETEVVSLINEGRDTRDIIRGLHHAMANRVASLAKSIEVHEEVIMTGGVAKNKGMFRALSEGLGVPVHALEIDPQINGAIGAALYAADTAGGD